MFSCVVNPFGVFCHLCLLLTVDTRQRMDGQTYVAQRPGNRNLPEASIDQKLRLREVLRG